jgi:SAM-dependent methyltransferase
MQDTLSRLIASGPTPTGAPDAFTEWCHDTVFTAELARAAALMERLCDLHFEDIYRRIGLGRKLDEARSAAELTESLGYVESAQVALEAMLWRLATRTDLVAVEEGDPLRYRAAREPRETVDDLAIVRAEIESLGEAHSAGAEFLGFGAARFDEALGDDPDLLDRMLSGREPELADLWHRATNLDPLQDVHGRMGAEAVANLFAGGTVLEVGGGTGNGTLHLFEAMKSRDILDRIERYVFSDVSMRFLLETRRVVQKRFPSVPAEWQFVDINRSLLEQKIEPASIDLVYGVNAAHVAKDILGFLKGCRRVLRPGGGVLFSERVRVHPRQMAPRELTLNLSTYHRSAAERNPDYRPAHCYLTPDNWLRVLDLAGFEYRVICPDLSWLANSFPDPYAAVVVAVRN